jgi:hypothetical protein
MGAYDYRKPIDTSRLKNILQNASTCSAHARNSVTAAAAGHWILGSLVGASKKCKRLSV